MSTEAYLKLLDATEFAEWAQEVGALAPGRLLALLTARLLEIAPPPLRRGRPPFPEMKESLGEAGLRTLLPKLDRPTRLSLAAGLLQAFDFWEESHTAAQTGEDEGERRFSPHWHGIAHRREPDPGNASYWYRRVGRSVVDRDLAEAAAARPLVAATLIRNGGWDAFAMIALCGRARAGSAEEQAAIELQTIEIARLLDASLKAFGVD